MASKRATSRLTRFAAMLESKLHVFIARLTVTLVGPTLYPGSLFFQGTGRTEKPWNEIAEIIFSSSRARIIFLILNIAISLLYICFAYHRKKLYINHKEFYHYCAVIYGNLQLFF